MIIIALLFHKLGHYFFLWITKNKLDELRTQLNWKRVLGEMSGVMTGFILAFLIIVTITLNSKEKYLQNENAVYGIEFSDHLKNIGFENGDKIISINNQRIVYFSDIFESIIRENGNTDVLILRANDEKHITISESDKRNILTSNTFSHIKPKLRPDSVSDISVNYLKYNERELGIMDAFATFTNSTKMSVMYLSPKQPVGGFIAVKNVSTVKGYLYMLAINSIFIGLINLIPLPGLDMGNALIALMEKRRNRIFNSSKLKIIRIICPGILLIVLLVTMFLI